MKIRLKTRLICLALLSAAGAVRAQDAFDGPGLRRSVVGSPHDLSVSGPGGVHALYEEQVCVFCHTPHRGSGQSPLWNRHMPPTHYRIYESSTTDARIDQPSGPSKKCLSCHDGALALGLVASREPEDPILMTHRTIPPGESDLTQDLSDDHPIGFRYDRALANRDDQIKNPDIVTHELPLGKHGEMHCTTCHDPHDNALGNFLRLSDERSAICLSCHEMNGWHAGSHAWSEVQVNSRAVDPRDRMTYTTVRENACANCHKIHSAPHRERLLRYQREESNCLNCHNGTVAHSNIASEFRKRSVHPVDRYLGRHDPTENPRTMKRHVECEDCHNPHAARSDRSERSNDSMAGLLDGSMQYVSGMSRNGLQLDRARFEYEICFKCHGDSISRPRQGEVVRQVTQTNTRLEFQTTNPSFHPVIGARNNGEVVSLIPPYRVGSVITCTACHNSDNRSGVLTGRRTGPHGSIYAPLLIANYSTDDFTRESAESYALCYTCHDRQSILADESFPLHNTHVVGERTPCSACHDAHGISRSQGNSGSHSHLINFDLSIVQPASGALGSRISFEDLGPRRGSCTLTCHGVVHVRTEYGR